MAYHGIPLVVHNHEYKVRLENEFYNGLKGTAFIDKPLIFSIQDYGVIRLLVGHRAICDDPIVFKHDVHNLSDKINWLSRDEIRELFFDDLELGATWMYE
jgi:hypothetical protein